ncbi:MAG: class I SAM-dependent methyltransferase [Flavobacteriales bacterium]|nr:class I SAM-dependent methyltransferase [Flavobacteriales bacterium]
MNDLTKLDIPKIHPKIDAKSKEIGFTMPADLQTGSLLKSLMTTKPKSRFLELGTGIGLSLCWMLDGMDSESQLVTIDNDPKLSEIATDFFSDDNRLEIICADGTEWINNYDGAKFDLIFADAWPGKYSETSEVLDLLNPGGIYFIDDMLHQPNWPDGHQQNVDDLVAFLEGRDDLNLTKMNWSTGLIIAIKKS